MSQKIQEVFKVELPDGSTHELTATCQLEKIYAEGVPQGYEKDNIQVSDDEWTILKRAFIKALENAEWDSENGRF